MSKPSPFVVIACIVILGALGTSVVAAAATPSVTWDTLEDYLAAEAAAGFTGAVLVVRNGKVVVDAGFGLANRERKIPIRPDTIFAVGSAPIDFTHAGILWLAQHGRLELSDPITKFFDNVPPDKRAITIEHLMTGASGLANFHDVATDRDPDHSWVDREEAMQRIFAGELLFAPGTGREHSHSAWGVLAAILEKVSGESYQDFTRKHLFRPAGMTDTGFNGDPAPMERLAIGYGPRSDGEVNAPPYWGKTSWLVMGSGGQTSTTRDTARWLNAMRDGKILDPEWAARYFGPGPGANRNGDEYGFEMFLYHAPMARSYAILMTNANKPSPGGEDATPFVRVSRAIGELVLDRRRPRFSLGVQLGVRADGVVEIGDVVADGAAAKAGVAAGDLLLAVNGVAVEDDPMAVLGPALETGEPVELRLGRGEETVVITVTPTATAG